MDATVPTTNFSSKPTLFSESPGGTSETRMPSRTTRNPSPPEIQAPTIPPGTSTACGFSLRSRRCASLMAAANM